MEARTILWRRHDIPGHEACRLAPLDPGWQLPGTAVFAFERQACRLDYEITCDPHWQTRSAAVAGWVGGRSINVDVRREASGQWQFNGCECRDVAGCVDIDLNFSPSTNLLPIRRLNLGVGQSAQVRAAWLRFPSFALEPFEQTYTRLEERVWRYESAGGQFVARIVVDDNGLVTEYGDIWSREDVA
ncbi:MAG TPA: putative glycolipid-binding domain-containing protein [Blastocatellia bacterium]|nr:putative glycolipid-binding domain-containing protein [Blastocatellia bacterium]